MQLLGKKFIFLGEKLNFCHQTAKNWFNFAKEVLKIAYWQSVLGWGKIWWPPSRLGGWHGQIAAPLIRQWCWSQSWFSFVVQTNWYENAIPSREGYQQHLPLFLAINCQNCEKYFFGSYWPFFGQKEDRILSDLNFETRFGILSSFSISYTPIC